MNKLKRNFVLSNKSAKDRLMRRDISCINPVRGHN